MQDGGCSRRVLVVGLDGATFRLLGPWLERGELPCLSRLYREGVRGTLQSVISALSPEAWSTFMTGKHPGQHGVMNFLSFRPRSYELQFNNGALIRQKTLWRLLSDAGKRVGVVGVPMTYPPEPVNGYLVAGLETPGAKSQFTHPPGLADELRASMGGYDLHGDFADCADPQEYLNRLLDMIDNQARAACHLLEKYPSDLTMVTIGATDRAQHFFWRFVDPSHPAYDSGAPSELGAALLRVYEQVDKAVEAMLQCVPEPRTVVIMSDHGFGPCHKLVHLNRWLEQEGYLVCARRSSVRVKMLQTIWGQASKHAPRWMKDWLKSVLPAVRSQVASLLLLNRFQWTGTKAFAVSTQHGYVYLNRRDRFPQGVVGPGAEAEALCDELTESIMGLRDADTGKSVVKRVLRTEDLYPGPGADALPDLIVLWQDGYIARSDAVRGRSDAGGQETADTSSLIEPIDMSSGAWNGCHTQDGVLVFHGPDAGGPGDIKGARLIDLAPTLLHLLGEPVPEDMTGRVLEDVFAPGFLASRPIRYCPADQDQPTGARESALSSAEQEEMAERLRQIGYME
jgi:predicted AlkP superfamily phosphohydrolase/phosphomutase